MPIGDICVREVVVTEPSTTAHEAARLMREHHVGDVVIVRRQNGKRIPVGILTDRDIVISVLGTDLDPNVFTAGDMIMSDLVTAREDQGIYETIQQMRAHGVRRMPITDQDGQLVGIVSIDDLIHLLAGEMNELSKLIATEQEREEQHKL